MDLEAIAVFVKVVDSGQKYLSPKVRAFIGTALETVGAAP